MRDVSIVDPYGEITSAVDLGNEDFFKSLFPSQKSEVYFKIQEMEGNIKKFKKYAREYLIDGGKIDDIEMSEVGRRVVVNDPELMLKYLKAYGLEVLQFKGVTDLNKILNEEEFDEVTVIKKTEKVNFKK
ncbi:hypothetical protein [Fructobacillus cardui]|uniref:hypothetical protein n=1 Tax=Fructobacillus cardui TaxID=2893170 RepID=UPI00200B2C42|nr:hypothetical protein [Fructobacillus cardui]MCK8628175.1 hypothetical protein [Fructobacillus cardui]